MRKVKVLFLCLLLLGILPIRLSYSEDLELLDQTDADLLKQSSQVETVDLGAGTETLNEENKDDLEALKEDVGPLDNEKSEAIKEVKEVKEVMDIKEVTPKEKEEIKTTAARKNTFDASSEEKKLLSIAKVFQKKIPESEWKEIVGRSHKDKYTVQKGDMLWTIGKRFFGSGFYYSKIWALNPHITNPHEIVPGMILIFDTGSEDTLPSVIVGDFDSFDLGSSENKSEGEKISKGKQVFDFEEFGDESKPLWLEERKKLLDSGAFFQFASEETYDDLADLGKKSLTREYEKYEPPENSVLTPNQTNSNQYDESGIDKESRISFKFKEGFFLNTFLTTNIVQDFGVIDSKQNESMFIKRNEMIYVKFDPEIKVRPGDKFSIYSPEGKVSHKISDRTGYRYTILAQIQAERKVDQLWECLVLDQTGVSLRSDRVTVYTPKIDKIVKSFNHRSIEAAIIGTYSETTTALSMGDVVYLDRGRADGVDVGNIFEAYSFHDRGTEKRITQNPTYKIGEVTIISVTDNFSTGLITNSSSEMHL